MSSWLPKARNACVVEQSNSSPFFLACVCGLQVYIKLWYQKGGDSFIMVSLLAYSLWHETGLGYYRLPLGWVELFPSVKLQNGYVD